MDWNSSVVWFLISKESIEFHYFEEALEAYYPCCSDWNLLEFRSISCESGLSAWNTGNDSRELIARFRLYSILPDIEGQTNEDSAYIADYIALRTICDHDGEGKFP